MHLTDALLFAVLALTVLGTPIALIRLLLVKSRQWTIVAEGLVAAVDLEEVEGFTTDPAESGVPTRPAVRTVITFDHGERVLLLGNYLSDCKQGDLVYVHQNKLGDFRIERRIGGADAGAN